ncbi:MAG: hypothetical protein RLZ55_1817 [Actinomycetota bacterium]|jgi:hypothetical protein
MPTLTALPRIVLATGAAAALLASCSAADTASNSTPPSSGSSSSPADTSSHGDSSHSASAVGLAPVAGEQIVSLSLPGGSYTPAPPNGGTDDYRCFVLDIPADAGGFATGFAVLPGNPAVTHHAILYKVTPEQVAKAQAKEAEDPQTGYECFGGSGLGSQALGTSDWITAWAPGGEPSNTPAGYGVELPAGGKVVLQMHYNTRKGIEPDSTKVELRLAPEDSGLKPLYSVLLPGPVEVPCPADQTGPLCDRSAAVADVVDRFGPSSLVTINGLHSICGQDPANPVASNTSSCTRAIKQSELVFAVAGHMHLLGKSITVDVNAGTPQEQRILDVPQYDFDQQGAVPLATPVQLNPGDQVTVTCTWDPTLRGKNPEIPDEPRYVVWGEGTTDEMCLGVMIVGRDS